MTMGGFKFASRVFLKDPPTQGAVCIDEISKSKKEECVQVQHDKDYGRDRDSQPLHVYVEHPKRVEKCSMVVVEVQQGRLAELLRTMAAEVASWK